MKNKKSHIEHFGWVVVECTFCIFLGSFDLQNGKYGTKQYKTEQGKTGQRKRDNIFYFRKLNGYFCIFYSCIMDKKLSCGLVKDKNSCFLSCPLLLILSSTKISF
jgi:hypothetical protein